MAIFDRVICAAAAVLFGAACGAANAADTLSQVKSRGMLRCGVSEGVVAGFSIKNKQGRWSGMDVDFCRAVAAVVLGSAEKVEFVPLLSTERFLALATGRIDLLSSNTTWTLVREAVIRTQFAGVLFYDGQGFLVPRKSGVTTIAGLKGATVCAEKGTTSAQNLADHAASAGLAIKPLVMDSLTAVTEAFFAGKCSAYTGDASQLAAVRIRAPGGPDGYIVLPERISKEPLGPAVRNGDNHWLTLVRWTLFILIAAEERGVTQANVRLRLREPALQPALGASQDVSRALGIDPDWVRRIVESVGNYGEMYERNVGAGSELRIERGLNRLWNQGGLMYSPPIR
jgi:general L-amino acid transport system substrate-binding protein